MKRILYKVLLLVLLLSLTAGLFSCGWFGDDDEKGGGATAETYNTAASEILIPDTDGGILRTTYNCDGNILSVENYYAADSLEFFMFFMNKDEIVDERTYTYNEKGQLTKITVKGGFAEETSDVDYSVRLYDEKGNAIYAVRDGIAENYYYNADPSPETIRFSYSAEGRLLTERGEDETRRYDSKGRLCLVDDGYKAVEYQYVDAKTAKAIEYGTDGYYSTENYEDACVATLTVNEMGMPALRELLANGSITKTSYEYDSTGKLSAMHITDGDAAGNFIYRYDDTGRFVGGTVTSVADGMKLDVLQEYTESGAMESISMIARDLESEQILYKQVYMMEYDDAGRLTQASNLGYEGASLAYKTVAQMEYDANGNLIWDRFLQYSPETNEVGQKQVARYEYDANGRIIKYKPGYYDDILNNDGYAFAYSFTYNAYGMLEKIEFLENSSQTCEYTYEYTYDASGFLSSIVGKEPGSSLPYRPEKTYRYDTYGRQVSCTELYYGHDYRDFSKYVLSDKRETTFEWDEAGNLRKKTVQEYESEFDVNMVTSIHLGNKAVYQYKYNADHLCTEQIEAKYDENGVLTYKSKTEMAYNTQGQITGKNVYFYDENGVQNGKTVEAYEYDQNYLHLKYTKTEYDAVDNVAQKRVCICKRDKYGKKTEQTDETWEGGYYSKDIYGYDEDGNWTVIMGEISSMVTAPLY